MEELECGCGRAVCSLFLFSFYVSLVSARNASHYNNQKLRNHGVDTERTFSCHILFLSFASQISLQSSPDMSSCSSLYLFGHLVLIWPNKNQRTAEHSRLQRCHKHELTAHYCLPSFSIGTRCAPKWCGTTSVQCPTLLEIWMLGRSVYHIFFFLGCKDTSSLNGFRGVVKGYRVTLPLFFDFQKDKSKTAPARRVGSRDGMRAGSSDRLKMILYNAL